MTNGHLIIETSHRRKSPPGFATGPIPAGLASQSFAQDLAIGLLRASSAGSDKACLGGPSSGRSNSRQEMPR